MEVTSSIPVGWQELSVFDIADRQKARFDDGDWVEALHITNAGVRLIQTGNIGVGSFIEKDNKKYIYETSFVSLKCKPLEIGDLLICRLAEPAGRACILPDIGDAKVVTSVDVSIFRPDPQRFDRGFLVQYLSTPKWFESVVENVGGTTHKRISRSALGKIKVSIPINKLEQSAIATALGDVDALLAAQNALIAKKHAIKQGAMQELLTGKRRLPGFSGEWEVKRLGDHLEFLGNGANSRAELMNDGRVRYLHYGDIHGTNEVLLNPTITAMPFLPEAKAVRLDRLGDGDLVFADASEDLDGVGKSVELQSVGKFEVVSGMHTIAVRFDKGILADGFKAYLQFIPSFQTHLRRLASGTKVYATNMSHIASAEVKLPSPAEQVAISAVFTDMDTELTALEAQRAKAVQLKQGMMQALLTGRIRLV
ncbi:restriction endonuclease subunit S [Stenotrophomonas sp.]|uniref:restriction endonuclease subunit S n=1 Tax=Stenotrophomonas sp. TaxID=69392 RepID=UPI0028AF427C|nr:restriction endonuclease subunit S [Stenotrophomonas sp.]